MLFDDPDKLSNEEIREELAKKDYPRSLIDSVIEQFWFHDWGNSFIAFPKHFQLLQEFLAENGPDQFSRFDFYSYFYRHLIPNYEKWRKSLQKLGLVFELMQTDKLDLSEFNNLLREISPPEELSVKFLQKIGLIFIERTSQPTVKWLHHTLTEFLVADHILCQKDPLVTARKFTIYSDLGTVNFIPSWSGALRFLLEQIPELFIGWIFSFIEENPDFLDDQLAETLIFSIPDSISHEYKAKLFHGVYDFYQQKKWWIPVWVYHHLYKFIDERSYLELRNQSDSQDYVPKGNIAAIIDGMLQHCHPLLNPKEKEFWKQKLIRFAQDKNDNGVLQRHALAALENYKGETDIIQKVQINAVSSDSLVREAYINMCRQVDPNSPDSINIFIKAIADDLAHIYARSALYTIDSQRGIKIFLQKIADNPNFIHEFLDKESIFNKKDKQTDKELVDNIRKNLNDDVIDLIKKIVIAAFTSNRNYHAGQSYFLRQLVRIVQIKQQGYLKELIETIAKLTDEQKKSLFMNEIEGIVAVLLKPEELEELQKVFTDQLHRHASFAFTEAIRLAAQAGNPQGEMVVKKGVDLGIIVDPRTLPQYEDYQKQQESKIYRQFQDYLNPPARGQYFPQVFRCFIENQKTIEKYWTESERGRLLSLAINSNLDEIEPKKIKVRYKNQESKSGEYTISSVAAYFPEVLQVIHKLKSSVLQAPKNRRKVINFIPFAYSNDLKVIQDILGDVADEELSTLNEIMLNNKNDARYLIPQTYIYFSTVFLNLKSPKGVLMSFVVGPLISDSDREFALRSLERYLNASDAKDKEFLISLWRPETRNLLSNRANALLISVFHDKKAIDWRLDILKSSIKPFRRQEGAHSVGELERELDNMAFAKPLIELNDEKYLDRFIDLLDFSLTIVDKPQYWEYVNYLWRIAIAFVIREDFCLSQSAFQELKIWSERNKTVTNINWFNKRLEQFKSILSQKFGKVNMEQALGLLSKH